MTFGLESFAWLLSGLLFGAPAAWLMQQARLAGRMSRQELRLERVPQLEAELRQTGEERDELRGELEEERRTSALLRNNLENEQSRFKARLDDLNEAKESMQKDFKVLATEILEQTGIRLTDRNKENLDQVVNPLKEHLEKFQKSVQENREKDAREQENLKLSIQNLNKLGLEMNTQAEELANALRSDAKAQGDWGEMILETILEHSGLRKGHEFESQVHVKAEDGSSGRLDVVVRLPQNRAVVIDSKVSLTAYTEYANATSEEAAKAALKRHVASVENHIKILGPKRYPELVGNRTLDSVLMFVPIESALSKALDEKSALFELALKNKIALVSPNLLVVALRIIEHQWQVDRQNRNAQEIADRAGKLYDKFCGFLEDMQKVGKELDDARTEYGKAMNKLRDGQGNLIRQVEMLKELGANTTKRIPPGLEPQEENEGDDDGDGSDNGNNKEA